MFIQVWYFLTLTLASLLMGTSFAHTLEMPAKMNVDGQLWRTFQHTLYPYFAYVGAPVLCYLVRAHQPAFYLTLAGTICLSLAFFVVWLGFTNPVNAETAKWTASSIPPDWSRWRSQWEYSHAARFVLHWIGFSALLISLIRMSSLPSAHHGSV